MPLTLHENFEISAQHTGGEQALTADNSVMRQAVSGWGKMPRKGGATGRQGGPLWAGKVKCRNVVVRKGSAVARQGKAGQCSLLYKMPAGKGGSACAACSANDDVQPMIAYAERSVCCKILPVIAP